MPKVWLSCSIHEPEQSFLCFFAGKASGAVQQSNPNLAPEHHVMDGSAAAAEHHGMDGSAGAADTAAASRAAPATFEDDFGADVFAGVETLQPAVKQHKQHTKPWPSSPCPLPAVQASAGDAPSSAAAVGDDELYGSLDLSISDIPQTDGAVDSPPQRTRGRGANPAERWEMGGGNDAFSGELFAKRSETVGAQLSSLPAGPVCWTWCRQARWP